MIYIKKKSSGCYIEDKFYINIRNKEAIYEVNQGKKIGHAKVAAGVMLRTIEFGCTLDSQKDFPMH